MPVKTKAPQRINSDSWRCVDFISDLHLYEGDPDTFMVWRRYMEQTQADAVFILGDWFEVWVGDDALQPTPNNRHLQALSFEERCARVCQSLMERAALYVMHGNRDFLLGDKYMTACGARMLLDPTPLVLGAERVLLSHGDALCIADTDYQAFRAQVRSSEWQKNFLNKPIEERQHIARSLRDASDQHKKDQSQQAYADVDASAARDLLKANHCQTLIHGHTHRPGAHELGDHLRRLVLSDWDTRARPPRAQVLRWQLSGANGQGTWQRIDLAV